MPTELEKAAARFDEKARVQIGMEQQIDPDRARRVMSMGNRYGIPYDIADASLEDLEIETRKADFNYEKWRKYSPKFAEYAAENPYNLTVLEDDRENLTMLERAWRPISMGLDKTWADVELMEIGARRAKGREYWQPDDEERMAELRPLSSVEHDFGADFLPHKVLVWTAKYLGPTLQTYMDSIDDMMVGGMTGTGVGAMAGSWAGPPGMAAGALAGWTTGMFVGGATGAMESGARLMTGEAYNNYIEQGFSHENAAIMAKGVGVIAGSLEVFPAGKFIKYIPGLGRVTDIAGRSIAERLGKDVLEKPTVAKATKALTLRYGEAMGTEIGVEIAQESIQMVGQNILAEIEMKPEASISWDEYTDNIAQVFVETAKATLLIAGVGPGMQFAGDISKANRASKTKAVWDTVGRGAKASKTAQKAPDTFRAFVARFAQGDKVWVDVEQWDRYWQGKKEDPNKIARQLNMSESEINEARIVNGAISIDASEFIEKIAPTEHHDGLTPHLKTGPDEMSITDAEYFRKNNPEIMKQLEAAMKDISEAESNAAADRIVQDVVGQLLQADVERHGANQSAQIFSGIANIAQRAGLDPDELYRQVFGGVTRVRDEILTKRTDVDLSLDPYLDMLREGKGPAQKQMFGPTLIDFIKSKGGLLDEGGELSAMDAAKEQRGLVRSKAGKSLDAMAELAAEAGFLPQAYTPNALLDAVRKELAGDPVRSRYEAGDPHLRELGTMLESLQEQLGMIGLDPETMTNEEIRGWLEKMERFDQLTPEEIAETLAAMDRAGASVGEVATDFANVFGVLDVIAASADFGNVQITDTVRIRDSGETVEMTAPAQSLFDKAKERKKNAKRLMDCLSG